MICVAKLRIKQTVSGIHTIEPHKRVLKALGLKHPGSVVERQDTPSIQGMIAKVQYLVSVEVIEEEK